MCTCVVVGECLFLFLFVLRYVVDGTLKSNNCVFTPKTKKAALQWFIAYCNLKLHNKTDERV